jgi:general secretion pathway protein B
MSYILDALRKADAERERDPARGIHAQPAALQPRGGLARGGAWPWMAGAGVGLLVAAGAVFWRSGAPPAPPTAPPPMTAAAPVQAVPAQPTPVVPAAEVQPPAPPMPAPVPVVPARAPAAAPTPAAPAAMPAAAQAQAPASSPAAAAAPAERVVPYADLPADVQRDLPKIVINGGVHSDNAAQRMLIVGGQVRLEGAELAPGLVLEQIRPKAAVLRFRGLRYSVPY